MSSTKVLTASLLAVAIAGSSSAASAQSKGYESFRRQTGDALTAKTT